MKFFDEKEAIEFIRSKVNVGQLSDDDLLDIIDAIFDFYDKNGDLDLDFDVDADDSDDDEMAIINYITEELNESDFSPALLEEIVKAELAYEQSLI